MQLESYEFQSDFVRGPIAPGREGGREEGRELGDAVGLQRPIFAVFAARGVPMDEDVRARVLACFAIDQRQAWLVVAATARSADAHA